MHKKIAALIGLIALFTPLARGSIIIHVSPHPEIEQYALIQASGTGGITTESFNTGSLFLSGLAFTSIVDPVSSGLTFGGTAVSSASPAFVDKITFNLESSLPAGNSYLFDGTAVIVSLPNAYGNIFIPGSYTIVSSSGIFGDDATGTLTIHTSPVPEPSTWALLSGLLVFGWVVRRRVKRPTIV